MGEDRKGTAEELSARFVSIRELLREAVERSAEFLDATSALLAEMPGDAPSGDGGDERDAIEGAFRLLITASEQHEMVAIELGDTMTDALPQVVAHCIMRARDANNASRHDIRRAIALLRGDILKRKRPPL